MAAPRDPYRYFRVEARELLDGLSQGLLALEREGASEAVLARLLRAAHTLKGAARVVKHQALADLAHAVESALEPLRADLSSPAAGPAAQVLVLLDAMGQQMGALEGALSVAPPAAAPPEKGAAAPPLREALRPDTVRLEVAELDSVMDGLREAVGRLATFKQQAEGRVDSRSLATLEQAERELLQAHDRAGRMRLLPASLLFDFLERVARDAAAAQGKAIRFEAQGAEQRLDAALLVSLQEALQHVVRNAVAHGLEEAGQRGAKAPRGAIEVALKRRGSQWVLSCQDDGRGIDPLKVAQAARAKGLLAREAPDLDMEGAIRLLLGGGLSTASAVTELSGRGIGLGILRSAVERLRGRVQVRSQAGQGTTIEVQVPVSLASYDALAVEAGGLPLLIPFHAVRETLRLEAHALARSPEGDTLLRGQEALPYLRLGGLFSAPSLAGGLGSALIVHSSAGAVALGVERVLGVREVLVLPLPELAPASPAVAGASLDASGDPCLVLDPEGLVAAVRARGGAAPEGAQTERLPLLVVDDSMTTRMLEQSILETAGYQVEVASSGEEGLAKVAQRRFGLILVDVEMPGMDGFEFLERLRGDPASREIPAIMVTSRDAPQGKRRGAAAGARDYVVKGEFDQARLLDRIRELLG